MGSGELVVPREGAYLTDGKRLVRVLMVMDDVMCLEDAVGDHEVLRVPIPEIGLWTMVREPDGA